MMRLSRNFDCNGCEGGEGNQREGSGFPFLKDFMTYWSFFLLNLIINNNKSIDPVFLSNY